MLTGVFESLFHARAPDHSLLYIIRTFSRLEECVSLQLKLSLLFFSFFFFTFSLFLVFFSPHTQLRVVSKPTPASNQLKLPTGRKEMSGMRLSHICVYFIAPASLTKAKRKPDHDGANREGGRRERELFGSVHVSVWVAVWVSG